MKTLALWLAALIFLLGLPRLGLAASFNELDGKLIFQPDLNLYRLRSTTKSWQLAGLPNGSKAEQTVLDGDRLYLVAVASGQRHLYSSVRGLRFEPVDMEPAEELKIKKIDDRILAFTKRGSVFQSYLVNEALVNPLIDLPLMALTEIERIDGFGGEIVYAQQLPASVEIYALDETTWSHRATINTCPSSTVIIQPTLVLGCPDQVYYPVSLDNWLPLFTEPIRSLAVSDELIAAQSQTNLQRFFIWQSDTLTTLDLPGLGAPQIAIINLYGSRLLLRTNALYEVRLTPVELSLVAADPTTVVLKTDNDNRLYRRQGATYYQSDNYNNWQLITVAADFNRARKTTNGWLLYQFDDDKTQFGQVTTYTTIPTSWATTSRIQEISEYQGLTYLWLYNSTSKPNLYKTTDFSQWTRITLPTTATLSPKIVDARLLPAGSDVELEGVISVPPNIVGAEIIYLDDNTGGIQIFLSASKGALPNVRNLKAVVNGEISSSQAKRVILEAPDDLELGNSASIIRPNLTPDEGDTYRGRTVDLEGKLTAAASDYLSFERTTAALKLHFQTLGQKYQKDDTLRVAAVVDYSSSSGQTEAWALGLNDELLNRPPVAVEEEEPAADDEPIATKTETKKATTSAAKPAPKVATSSTTTKKVTPTAIAKKPATKVVTPTVQVAATQSRNIFPTEVVVMSLVSLLAGLLAVRGRRLKRFLGYS